MFVSGNVPAGAEYKAALSDVLQAFPYFQLAQVLFAKQMYDNNEPEAPGRIKLASVYAPDRKAMYLLFKKPAETDTTVKTSEKPEVKYNFVYNSPPANKSVDTEPIPVKKESKPTPLPETFIRKELEKKPLVPAPSKETEKKTETAPVPADLPVEKSVPAPLMEEKKAEAEKIVPVEAAAPMIANEPIEDINLKYSFNSWLKVLPEISVEKEPEVKPVSQKKSADLIDTFLKKQPSISRPKAEFFSPVKAAKMSVTEDDTIVSETLAKIFFDQGNLPKALKAYQSLLVQFPEKSNIFAPRIEEIKTLIRENTKPGTK